MLGASALLVAWSGRRLATQPPRSQRPLQVALVAGVLLLCASTVVELQGQLATALRPTASSYGAVVYMVATLQALFVAFVAFMGIYTVARSAAGLLAADRRTTFDNTRLFWYYTVAQGLAGLALVHGFPRFAS
jgi:cytochrome c oxidase subunit I+III